MASISDERSQELEEFSDEESLATLKRKVGDNVDSEGDKRQREDGESEDESLLPGIFVKVEVEEVNDQDIEDEIVNATQATCKPIKPKSHAPIQKADPDLVTGLRPPKRKKSTSCPDCGEVFSNKVDMKQHAIRHQVQTRHKCDECGRCFSKAFGLKTHKRMHGEKNQHCPLCEASFTMAINLSSDDVRPNKSQRSALVGFLEANPHVARDVVNAPRKLNEASKWELIAPTLNSLGEAKKDGPGWVKYWMEMKRNLERLAAERGTARLSLLGRKMVAIIDLMSKNSRSQIKPTPQTTDLSANTAKNRTSYSQMEELVSFLQSNRDIALAQPSARLDARSRWDLLADKLNRLGGAVRDGVGWAKFWTEKKSFLKKATRKADSQVHPTDLSSLESKMVALLGFKTNSNISLGSPKSGSSDADYETQEPEDNDSPVLEEEKDQLEMVEDVSDTDASQGSPRRTGGSRKRSHKAVETTDNPKRVLSCRLNDLQSQKLLDFLERNPTIARGFLRTAQGRGESKAKWAKLARKLNAMGEAKKDGRGWSKFWSEKKCYLKRVLKRGKASILSDFDSKMAAIMTANLPPHTPNHNEEDAQRQIVETSTVNNDTDSMESTEDEVDHPITTADPTIFAFNTCRPSHEQLVVLAEFLNRHPTVGVGDGRSAKGRRVTRKQWTSVAATLNRIGGACRDGRGWAKYWCERKCYLKRTTDSTDGVIPQLFVADGKILTWTDEEKADASGAQDTHDGENFDKAKTSFPQNVQKEYRLAKESVESLPRQGNKCDSLNNGPVDKAPLNYQSIGRTSYSQAVKFVEMVEQNPSITKLHRTIQAKYKARKQWDSMATELNALEGAQKDGAGWHKYWREKKCQLKKVCAAKAFWWLSELDTRIVAAIAGPDFATCGQDLMAMFDQEDRAEQRHPSKNIFTYRQGDIVGDAYATENSFATSCQDKDTNLLCNAADADKKLASGDQAVASGEVLNSAIENIHSAIVNQPAIREARFATNDQNGSAVVCDKFASSEQYDTWDKFSAKGVEAPDCSLNSDEEGEMEVLVDSDDPLSTGEVFDENGLVEHGKEALNSTHDSPSPKEHCMDLEVCEVDAIIGPVTTKRRSNVASGQEFPTDSNAEASPPNNNLEPTTGTDLTTIAGFPDIIHTLQQNSTALKDTTSALKSITGAMKETTSVLRSAGVPGSSEAMKECERVLKEAVDVYKEGVAGIRDSSAIVNSLGRHMMYHHKRMKCDHCDAYYETKELLYEHKLTEHPEHPAIPPDKPRKPRSWSTYKIKENPEGTSNNPTKSYSKTTDSEESMDEANDEYTEPEQENSREGNTFDVYTKKEDVPYQIQCAIVSKMHKGRSVSDICQIYNLTAEVINEIWEDRDEFVILKRAGRKSSKYMNSVLDRRILDWINSQKQKDVQVTGKMLMDVAESFAKESGFVAFNGSKKWLDRFKTRYKITFRSKVRKKREWPNPNESKWKKQFLEETWLDARNGFADEEIYTADECGVYYNPSRGRIKKQHGKKFIHGFPKDRLSIFMCTNVTGSDKKKLLVCGTEDPLIHSFRSPDTLPVTYIRHPQAHFTTPMFEEYVKFWNRELQLKNRKAILILDRATIHSKLTLSHLKLIFVPWKAAQSLMPIKNGIFNLFRDEYRRLLVQEKAMNALRGVDRNLTCLEALNLLEKAWERTSSESILNCFASTGYEVNNVCQLKPTIVPKVTEDDEAALCRLLSEFDVEPYFQDSRSLDNYITVDEEFLTGHGSNGSVFGGNHKAIDPATQRKEIQEILPIATDRPETDEIESQIARNRALDDLEIVRKYLQGNVTDYETFTKFMDVEKYVLKSAVSFQLLEREG